MDIRPSEIQYQKRIGHIGSKPVMEIGTLGGLKVVGVSNGSGKLKILGAGSHRRIARFLAQKAEPTLEIDALEKSEDFLNPNDFKELVQNWADFTALLAAKFDAKD